MWKIDISSDLGHHSGFVCFKEKNSISIGIYQDLNQNILVVRSNEIIGLKINER